MSLVSTMTLEQVRALAVASPQARSETFLQLAQAAATEGEATRVAGLVQRAWEVAGLAQREALVEVFRDFHLQLGDVEKAKAGVLRVALDHAAAGRVETCLGYAEAWQYAYPRWVGEDTYHYDEGLLGALRNLAAPYRGPARLPDLAPGQPLRVAYLVFGGTHRNSVIVKLTRIFAEHHGEGRVKPAFFFPDPEEVLQQSLQGGDHLASFRALGHPVQAARGATVLEGLLALAGEIRAFDPHVLVTTAALADFKHYFLASLFPHLPRLAQVSGPPAQFVPPDFDEGIAWTLHPLLDSPIPCSQVPLEIGLPDPGEVPLRSRAELGLPEEAVVLGAGGRHLKFRHRGFWNLLLRLLADHPGTHFLAVGVKAEEVAEVLPPLGGELAGRIHFQPWQDDYLATLGVADLLLDTFPSGGGVVVQDMMAMGRPVVAFANDYLRPFHQVTWSPAQEFLPPGDLRIPHGDEARYLAVAGRLITDAAYRRELGEQVQGWIFQHYDRPDRMVRRCEQIYAKAYERRRDARVP